MMKKTGFIVLSMLLVASCFAAIGTGSSATLTDTRDYTLQVVSDKGSPTPAVGTHTYPWGSTITCSAGAQAGYTCTGWSGTGSIPGNGAADSTGEIDLNELTSTITWIWEQGGDGTASNPYQISTREHLEAVNNSLSSHYILINDIDLNGTTYTHAVIAPDTDMSSDFQGTTFTGSFNGNGFVVKNLTIIAPSAEYLGLFGYFNSGASISNVGVEDCNISGYRYIGGLVGYIGNSWSGTITNCYSSGNVNSLGSNVGGLVGRNEASPYNGFIANCYSTANVGGTSYVGGLVGLCRGLLANSFATGSVIGTGSQVGGLVGSNEQGSMINSYATGSVSGSSNVGGLVGLNSSIVKNCYSTGFVSGLSNVGGLIGSGGTVINSFWDIDTSGQPQIENSYLKNGITSAQMKQRATYVGWNFNTLWAIDEGNSYPVIQDLSVYSLPHELILADLEGDGTADAPYIITSADELNAVRQNLTAHYSLANDIDLSASVVWNGGLGWKPIGDFTGVFDANGCIIRDMAIESLDSYIGLFGRVGSGGVITNLGIENCHITGMSNAGGLVGYNNYGTITNCYVTGAITAGTENSPPIHAGGLVGRNLYGAIKNCHANVDVIGSRDNLGGLVGYNSGPITNCYATGTVSRSGPASFVGGLVGYNSGPITHCYATGDVNGSIVVGGLIGESWGYSVENCYSIGNVSGNQDVGGLIGRSGTTQTIVNCYWDIETSGQAASRGGSGRTTAEMKQQATYIGWSFVFWTIDEGISYPSFRDLSGYSLPQAISLNDLAGSGVSGDPYIITNADELNAVRQDLTAHYLLGNDIDLSASIVWNDGLGWNPIGTSAAGFTGVFDGNGFAIENLTINSESTDYVGLFRIISSSGIVKNLALKGCNLSCHWNMGKGGGLAGGSAGTIQNCCVLGNINGGYNTGGLVGLNTGTITLCYFSGYVNGSGGLVGVNNSGTIANCYAKGYKNYSSRAGGLLGENRGTVTNCYAVVYFTDYYIGFHPPLDEGLISRNFGVVTNSFWDMEETGILSSDGGVGKTTAEMQTQSTYTGWDFVGETANGVEDIWYMEPGGYPRLNGVGGDTGGLEIDSLIIAAVRRVSRTEFEYDVAVKVKNKGQSISDAVIMLVGFPANVRVLGGGVVAVGALGSGNGAICEGIITLRIDRATATNTGKITWHAQVNRPLGGQNIEVVQSELILVEFGSGGLGQAEIMEIAANWLGTGMADVNYDGVVNYEDIAILSGGM